MVLTYKTMPKEPEKDKIRLRIFDCPSCAAPVQQFLPGKTTTVICASCTSVIDASHDVVAMLEKHHNKARRDCIIPLGQKGRIRGRDFLCLGFMIRKDVEWHFTWHEYLLFNPLVGYRWLAQCDGHWSYITPCKSQGKIDDVRASYEGKTYRKFHAGKAQVIHVVGEFYWRVKVGDQTSVVDYINPPEILSQEKSDDEVSWSIGDYINSEDVAKGFKLAKIPTVTGIAPHQPSPYSHNFGSYFLATFAMWLLLLFMHVLAVSSGAEQHAFEKTFLFTKANATSTAPPSGSDTSKSTYLSEPFELKGNPKNVMLQVTTNLSNQWAEVFSSLINEANGELIDITSNLSYYSGYDGGESWSEGSNIDKKIIHNVPDGTYRLRVEADSDFDDIVTWPAKTGPGFMLIWTPKERVIHGTKASHSGRNHPTFTYC